MYILFDKLEVVQKLIVISTYKKCLWKSIIVYWFLY